MLKITGDQVSPAAVGEAYDVVFGYLVLTLSMMATALRTPLEAWFQGFCVEENGEA